MRPYKKSRKRSVKSEIKTYYAIGREIQRSIKMTDPIQEVETSFEKDNFTSRRTTGHNLFDPDSLLTGAEEELGLTYTNSSRKFPSLETREAVIRGEVSQADVVRLYPRTLNQ